MKTKIILAFSLSACCGLGFRPASAQYTGANAYGYNNMMSATLSVWNQGQMNMLYSNSALNRAIVASGGASAGQLQSARGRQVIRAKRATTRFVTRPFPISVTMKTDWNGSAEDRKRNYAEWLAQKAIFAREAKARGAQSNDMAHMYALVMVMCHEAHTGQRIKNSGFHYMVGVFHKAFGISALYQGRTATSKQEFFEKAMLTGSYALYLRRSGNLERAKTTSAAFMDEWWTTDTMGVINTLAPHVERARVRIAKRPPAQTNLGRVAEPKVQPQTPANTPLTYRQAEAITRFSPVAESVFPAMMVQNAEQSRRGPLLEVSETLLREGRAKVRALWTIPAGKEDVAEGLTYAVLAFLTLSKSADGGTSANISSRHVDGLSRQITMRLASNPKFRSQSARQKQAMYESVLLMATLQGTLMTRAQKSGDAQEQAQVRQQSAQALQKLIGVAPDKIRLTDNGLETDS